MTGQRYVNLLSDAGFKAVFADEKNKAVVITFLNVILAGEREVADITYVPGELPGRAIQSKGVRFDLFCRDTAGAGFIVEMQRAKNSTDFFQRSVYYGCKVYESQLPAGARSYLAPPVYVIGIMESSLPHEGDCPDIISRYSFLQLQRHILAPSTISCIFVQLRNFKLSETECQTDFDRWCFSIKNGYRLQEKPSGFKEQQFELLFDACEIAQFDKDKRLRYDDDMMTETDYWDDMDSAKRAGVQQGIQQGLQQGRLDVASKMKAASMSIEVICQMTGLSVEEVEALN